MTTGSRSRSTSSPAVAAGGRTRSRPPDERRRVVAGLPTVTGVRLARRRGPRRVRSACRCAGRGRVCGWPRYAAPAGLDHLAAMSADVDRSVVPAGAYHWHATAAAHGVGLAGHRARSLDPGAASAGFVGVANATGEGAARRRIDRQAITARGGSAATSRTWRRGRAARRRRWFPAVALQLLELLAQLLGLGHRSFAALCRALFAASVGFSPSDLIRPQPLLLGVAARRHSSRQHECSQPTEHRTRDKSTTTSCHIDPFCIGHRAHTVPVLSPILE